MPLELGHEGLAEAHDLGVGLALGVEVGSSLSSSDGEGGKAVLEDLLESEELQDGQVDGGVEPESALVGPDGGVELNTVSAVDLDLSVVVNPWDAEHDDPLGLDEPLDDSGLLELGPRLDDGLEGLEDLLDGLKELGLVGVALFETVEDGLEILVCDCHSLPPYMTVIPSSENRPCIPHIKYNRHHKKRIMFKCFDFSRFQSEISM